MCMYLVNAELLIYIPSVILDQGLSLVEVTSQEQKEIVPLFNVHFSSLIYLFSLLLTS